MEDSIKSEFTKDNILALVSNTSNLQMSTLIRAAKLSPFIKDGITIGPNINEAPNNLDYDYEISEKINNTNKNASKIYNKHIDKPDFHTSGEAEMLDINLVNAVVILKINENTRKMNVKKAVQMHLDNMSIENRKQNEMVDKYSLKNEWIQNKMKSEEKIQEMVEQYVENEIEFSLKQTEKILMQKQRRLQQIVLDAIVHRRNRFTLHYEKICQSLKSETNNTIEYEEYNKNLQDLINDFDNLIQEIKNNNMGHSEILAADSLCQRIEQLDKKITADIENQAKLLQQKSVIESQIECSNQSNQEQQQQNVQIENFNRNDDSTDGIENTKYFTSFEALNFYSEIITYFTEKLQTLAALESDPNMKKFLAACRRTINIPVAAICAVSPQHMQDKFDKIMNFILGNTKKQSTSDVHVSEHPLAKDYCIRYLARKLIAVAGTEISSNAQAAFPFASIIIAIWNRIPEFGKLFLGQMFTECIFLVPLLFPRSNFQSDIDYKLSYGYYINDNVLEDFNSFNKRQAGIVRLFAAIFISHGRHDDLNHPFPIDNGWKWLSNFINIKPEMHDICATIIVEFLQIAAHEMLTLYGKQFKKLLIIIQDQYLAKLNEIEEGKAASKGKLELTLELILKYNRVEKPQGILQKNFW